MSLFRRKLIHDVNKLNLILFQNNEKEKQSTRMVRILLQKPWFNSWMVAYPWPARQWTTKNASIESRKGRKHISLLGKRASPSLGRHTWLLV
jgi:hypothetical protein